MHFNSFDGYVFGGSEGPVALSINDTCRTLGISRSKVYQLFKTGELAYVKLGKRRVVERAAIQKLLSSHRVEGLVP